MTTTGYQHTVLMNVVGLPLAEVVDVLKRNGVIVPVTV